jgi:Domain of unknown function (DUF4123)
MQTVNSIFSELVAWYELPNVKTVCFIVDPCTHENLTAIDSKLAVDCPKVFPIKLAGTDVAVEESPALVLIEKDDWQLRQRSVEQALFDLKDINSQRFISSWVATSATPQSLAQKLTQSMDVRLISGKRTVLRHHDPRVRQYIEAVAGFDWLLSLVPDVKAWAYLRHDSQWSSWTSNLDLKEKVELSPLIKKALLQSGEVNRVVQLAMQEKLILSQDFYSVVHRAFEKTEKYGYANEDDRLAFGLHSLMLGLGFESRPQIAAALSLADKKTSYCDAVAHLSAVQWESIKQEANAS